MYTYSCKHVHVHVHVLCNVQLFGANGVHVHVHVRKVDRPVLHIFKICFLGMFTWKTVDLAIYSICIPIALWVKIQLVKNGSA